MVNRKHYHNTLQYIIWSYAPLVVPAASIPASVVSSSSSSVAGHMVYPGGHTVMYATPTSSLTDGSLTVLNTFPPAGSAQSHDAGEKPITLCSSTTSWATAHKKKNKQKKHGAPPTKNII